jgi:chromosome segregation ATPase
LLSAQAQVEQQVKRLTETLAEENKRRENLEQHSSDIGQRATRLEAELAESQQAQVRLRHELETLQQQLQAHQESSRAEKTSLEARTQELQSAHAQAEQQVKRLTETLAEENKRRENLEQHASEIGQRATRLEAELAESQRLQARLRHELETSQQQLQAHRESSRAEKTRLEAQTQELQSTHAQVEQQAKDLTEALAQQTRRWEIGEQQSRELGQRHARLEAELSKNQDAQATLHRELGESQKQLEVHRENYLAEQSKLEARTKALEVLTRELAAVRGTVEEQSLQCRKLAEKVAEEERAKAELITQVDSATNLLKAREHSIRSLDSQVQERQAEVHKLGALLQSEIAQRRQEQSQIEALERKATELNGQLTEKIAEEQRWLQRELELGQRIGQQKDQLATSAAAAAIQEVELKTLRNTIEEMRVIQSALCARIREVNNQEAAAASQAHELQEQWQAAARKVQERDRELAALRHGILDAARIGTHIGRERLQAESQVVDGWKRMMTALLHTPLSMTQRRLISEITSNLDGWRKGRADGMSGTGFHVEAPDLHCSDFNCAEVIEHAFVAVREDAAETGVKAETSFVGPFSERLHGNPQQIHQLITLLAASLPAIGCTENLEVQLSLETQENGTARLLVSVLLTSTDDAEALCLRLGTLTEASAYLRAARSGGPELALTSAWQLALAMGADPSIETTYGKVGVKVSLPLETSSSIASEGEPDLAI